MKDHLSKLFAREGGILGHTPTLRPDGGIGRGGDSGAESAVEGGFICMTI